MESLHWNVHPFTPKRFWNSQLSFSCHAASLFAKKKFKVNSSLRVVNQIGCIQCLWYLENIVLIYILGILGIVFAVLFTFVFTIQNEFILIFRFGCFGSCS